MRLTVTNTNFYSNKSWLFKLEDDKGNIYTIPDDNIYKQLRLKTPITKKQLDYYDIGTVIYARVTECEGKKIIVEIFD